MRAQTVQGTHACAHCDFWVCVMKLGSDRKFLPCPLLRALYIVMVKSKMSACFYTSYQCRPTKIIRTLPTALSKPALQKILQPITYYIACLI